MKVLNLRTSLLVFFYYVLSTSYAIAQQGRITINQDVKIKSLLELKKEMNNNEDDNERYKIQIYSGNRIGAEKAQADFKEAFIGRKATDIYQSPNFKVWTGNFRTRLEADRALRIIQTKFSSAFIFKPKK